MLIKIIFGNLLIYYMSLLTIPGSVAKKLEVIRSRFIWRDMEG